MNKIYARKALNQAYRIQELVRREDYNSFIEELKQCVKVDNILALKKDDKEADIQEVENEINKLVYKLCNLIEKEIKVIELS